MSIFHIVQVVVITLFFDPLEKVHVFLGPNYSKYIMHAIFLLSIYSFLSSTAWYRSSLGFLSIMHIVLLIAITLFFDPLGIVSGDCFQNSSFRHSLHASRSSVGCHCLFRPSDCAPFRRVQLISKLHVY